MSGLLGLACGIFAGTSSVQADPYLGRVTGLAGGALNGVGVTTPIAGAAVRLQNASGQLLYERGFGNLTPGTSIASASAAKTLSGGLMLDLVEDPTIPYTLDTRAADYFPADFTGLKAGMTVRQMFSHTAGLGSQFTYLTDDTITLQQATRLIGQNVPLIFGRPGTKFGYGGNSMQVAGGLGEAAARTAMPGVRWSDLFDARIAAPLGLTDTHYANADNPHVGGGFITTTRDYTLYMSMLARDGVALNGTRVLDESSVLAMRTDQTVGLPYTYTPAPAAWKYGLGVWLSRMETTGDVAAEITAAGAGGLYAWADFDRGLVGTVGAEDAGQNVQALTFRIKAELYFAWDHNLLAGDANLDGAVDVTDLGILAANFRITAPTDVEASWRAGEFTGDGVIDVADLGVLAANFRSSSTTFTAAALALGLPVPEPTAMVIGVLPLAIAQRRRRSIKANGLINASDVGSGT